MKRVLCYGDSNTWRYISGSNHERYNCYFLSNDDLETGIDGVHLTKESHKDLALMVANRIKIILE